MSTKSWLYGVVFLMAVFSGNANAWRLSASSSPIVAGYIENAWLKNGTLSLAAKLDTGAKTSSIHAPMQEEFRKGGARWVRFGFTDNKGSVHQFEAPVVRVAVIRRAGVKKQERLVVRMSLCIGGKSGKTEFTLADRTGLSYRLLIGRVFMKSRIFVDSGRKYIASFACQK